MEKKHKIGITLGTLGVVMILFGVTFAFFNYTRTGVSNVIKVGKISFESEQTNTITLLDVFPIDATDVNTSNHVGTGTINITGDTTYDDGVEYVLTISNLTNTVGSKEIPIDVVVTGSGIGTEDSSYFDNRGGNSSIYKVLTSGTISNNKQLLVGYITEGQSGVNGTVTIKAYLDKDKIAISDTYPEGTVHTVKTANYSSSDCETALTGVTNASTYCASASSLQTAIDNSNLTSAQVTLLVNAGMVDEYIDGTTSTWVAGRTVLTTTEWNSLQANGVSFQVKVEANEGIWVKEPGVDKVKKSIASKVSSNACTPTWTDTDDGIIYLSGDNTCIDFNYVWYSGKLWRITAIYPDGAMKLITENNITTIAFNTSGQVNFYTDANTTSYMYQWLNEDFYDTLYNPTNFIDTTKRWNATNSNASSTSEISTKLAETTMVEANVGLLNSYEYYNSYRCVESSACTGTGTSYYTGYLNIKYYWWLLNPYNASYVWDVTDNGIGNSFGIPANVYGARPSIVIKSGLEFTGNGTIVSPYKIVGDKDTGSANELINTRMSGEYVKLKAGNNEQVFRIIGVEENKTKIIAMDYADNKATKKFAVGNTSGDGTIYGTGQTATQGEDTWYNYLTGTYEPNLEITYGQIFDSSTYYMGQIGNGQSYKLGICSSAVGLTKNCTKTSQVGTFKIGLPRYGEMFAAQQAGGISNSIAMWLINRYNASIVWYVYNNGPGNYLSPTIMNGARPTLHLKSTVKILSGTGLPDDPYVVGL